MLCMADFAVAIKQSRFAARATGGDELAAELAYDLTMEKFLSLPESKDAGCDTVDCVRYYRAFLLEVERRIEFRKARSVVESEQISSDCLQGFFLRTFTFACREAVRRRKGWVRRYRYRFGKADCVLWVPTEILGDRIHDYLDPLVTESQENGSELRAELQAAVDRIFRVRGKVSLSALQDLGLPSEASDSPAWRVSDLAETVASEKACNLDAQRPAIRRLGSRHLRLLITEIFQAISDGGCVAAEIAARYDLSPATYSRFAGLRWLKGNGWQVPDLWRNTIGVLCSDPRYAAAAGRFLRQDRVQQLLREDPRNIKGATDHHDL